MPQNNEQVILEIGGTNYSGWMEGTIKKSIKSLSGNFKFSFIDSDLFNSGAIFPGDTMVVSISDILGIKKTILTGFIDSRTRTRDGKSEIINIAGREKTADLVDCGAVVPSNTFLNATLGTIVRAVCKPFDINVIEESTSLEKFKKFTIQPDESAFNVIDRLCKMRAVIPITDALGNLVITNTGGIGNPALNLELGNNIKFLTESENYANRYSEYIVKGQDSSAGAIFSTETTRASATATDGDIKRHRPLIIMAETKANTKRCQDRANWEAQYRAGDARKYYTSVLGWFQEQNGSKLWEVNTDTTLIAEAYDVTEDLVISEIEYTIAGKGGRECKFTLENPIVFEASPSSSVPTTQKKGLFG